MVTLLTVFVQSVSFAAGTPDKKVNNFIRTIALDDDIDVVQPQELIERIAQATKVMDSARDLLFDEKVTQLDDVDNAKTIIKQNSIIVQTQLTLDKLQREQLAQQSPVSPVDEGYLSRLVSGVKNVGTGFLERMKSWYGYTEGEKELARNVIDGLKQQKAEITHKYVSLFKELTADKRDILKKRYRAVVMLLNAEIQQQRYITGEETSLQKKLLWGTAAATVAGVLAHKNLGATPETTKATLLPTTPTTEISQQPVKPAEVAVVQGTPEIPVVTQQKEREVKEKIVEYNKNIADMKKRLADLEADLKNKKIEIPVAEYDETQNERASRLEKQQQAEQSPKRISDIQVELERQKLELERQKRERDQLLYQSLLQQDPQHQFAGAQKWIDEFTQDNWWNWWKYVFSETVNFPELNKFTKMRDKAAQKIKDAQKRKE